MSQRRYEGACNRIADANVTFCERGGAVKRVTDFLCNKKSEQSKVRSDVGAGEGFEPPTSGLSLRAGRRRVSQTFACSALFARTLGDTALKNNSPDCF